MLILGIDICIYVFQASLLITLDGKTTTSQESKIQLFEFKVAYDPKVYRRPYLAILGAWSIIEQEGDSKMLLTRGEELHFPQPRYQIESWTDRIRYLVNGMISKYGFGTVSAIIVVFITSFVGLFVYACCVHEYKIPEKYHDKDE